MIRPGETAAATNRLGTVEAEALLRTAETAEIMEMAAVVRRRLHGRRTYFTHSLNVNPTNVCLNRCELCAFWRDADVDDAYMLTLDKARQTMQAARQLHLSDLHVVGGVRPELTLAYYERLICDAREILPGVLIQGLTAVEIHYLAEAEGLTVDEILRRLRDAGLGAIPGGGAEIFNEPIRGRICSRKISAQQWLDVHRRAHRLGIASNATMLFGHIEDASDIVDHLDRLRRCQDETGGFLAFIPLPFHAHGTQLSVRSVAGGDVVARVVSLARLFLDNFPHIRVLANYTDRKLLQLLTAVADDVGPTSLDERIARSAGAPSEHKLDSIDAMEAFVSDLDLEPVLVNSRYESRTSRAIAPPVRPKRDHLAQALGRADRGERLSPAEAIALHDEADLFELGRLAHARRMQVVPQRRVTFTIDRNISVTNVCVSGCLFCAFHVPPGDVRAFVIGIDEIVEKVRQAKQLGATQIMIQGGLNPALSIEFYEDMFRAIKRRCGQVWLHSLSPAEVLYLARQSGSSIIAALERLREAGLDSLPGGGAEILVDEVRRRVSPGKITADEWFEVMAAAQKLGMTTTATMVYGLGETTAQRVEHLVRIRQLQDQTGGFTAFIPWSLQCNRTHLNERPQSGPDYLRIVALARLVLDNVPHIQAGWVTEGADLAQVALSFGADDFGGVLMEERVVRATGVSYEITIDRVVELIRQRRMVPAQRSTQYDVLRLFDGEVAAESSGGSSPA